MRISRVAPGSLLFILVMAILCGSTVSQTLQPTVYVGSDIEGLEAALAQDSSNLGLRMRVVEALLAGVQTASINTTRDLMEQVEEHVDALIKASPHFAYPYRVLAKLTFRRQQYGKCLELLDAFAKITPLDYQMRSIRLKCLLRSTEGTEGEAGVNAAAEYLCDWLESGAAPSFGRTLGSLQAWLANEKLRDALLAKFEERHAGAPSNLNLALSYAGCLSVVGRSESAWWVVQEGERQGLCDVSSGSRHPIALILEADCIEPKMSDGYAGFNTGDLQAASKKYPGNISLALRVALSLKNKAVTQNRKQLLIEARLKSGKSSEEERARLSKLRDELEVESNNLYREALPYAIAVQKANPTIDVVPLMIGDIYYKLGQFDEAADQLQRGIKLLPGFTRLREVLAQVYMKTKNWDALATQLAAVCRVRNCRADLWDTDARDSLLPVPKVPIERMIADLMEDSESRGPVISAFTKAVAAENLNPNQHVFLAMMHFFAGDKSNAVSSMATAERHGVSGKGGAEHYLATLILIRENW